jgi:cbb3-type cytochrome oxidase maturation protein
MELICLILPLALVIAAGFVAAFIWAAKGDQFEDLDTPAIRMLHDDAAAKKKPARDRT